MMVRKTVLNGLLVALISTLSACNSGSGAGDSVGAGDITVQTSTESNPGDTLDQSDETVNQNEVVDQTNETNEANEEADQGDEIAENDDSTTSESVEEPQVLNAGQSVSGSLNANEFVTFRVPTDNQVVLTSNTGDSDIFLFDSPEFTEEGFICGDTSFFREDTCSSSSASDFVFAAVAARNSSDYTISVTNDCSIGNINQWVYRNMQDFYLFADQIPVVNPLDYDSPSDLVQDLRFNELEPFSSISDAVTQQTMLNEGREISFGYQWERDNEGDLRVRNVVTDSPFGRAGVQRGDIFHSLGGIPDGLLSNEVFSELIGTQDEPRQVEWTFVDGETGELNSFVTAQAEHSINTIAFVDAYENSEFDGLTGYIVFNGFLSTSVDELDQAIERLRDANVTELVLDLRYNRGGFTFVARRLAAQLSGNRLTDQVLSRTRYNDSYSDYDGDSFFEDTLPALDLSRVIVLTSKDTASASELVINSLKPYMEVVTIGDRSGGKPFQSRNRTFCGMSLNAMDSELVNAADLSVAGGIGADCFAEDDLTHRYGIREGNIEGMLLSALDYVVFGTCDVAPSTPISIRNSPESTAKEWDSTDNFSLSTTAEISKPWPFHTQ